mmetsp:Transcript_4044/g.6644  ORF Transcript_4044/g.6644 Transcript_4044/m.6644 type:complete len:107 (-) Transcript_4044:325-645(-)
MLGGGDESNAQDPTDWMVFRCCLGTGGVVMTPSVPGGGLLHHCEKAGWGRGGPGAASLQPGYRVGPGGGTRSLNGLLRKAGEAVGAAALAPGARLRPDREGPDSAS